MIRYTVITHDRLPCVREIEIVRETALQAHVDRASEGSSYRTWVHRHDVYETRAAAVAVAARRCAQVITDVAAHLERARARERELLAELWGHAR